MVEMRRALGGRRGLEWGVGLGERAGGAVGLRCETEQMGVGPCELGQEAHDWCVVCGVDEVDEVDESCRG